MCFKNNNTIKRLLKLGIILAFSFSASIYAAEKWESRKTILSDNQGYTYDTYTLDDTAPDYLKTLLKEFVLPEKATLSEVRAKWKEYMSKYPSTGNQNEREQYIKYNDLYAKIKTKFEDDESVAQDKILDPKLYGGTELESLFGINSKTPGNLARNLGHTIGDFFIKGDDRFEGNGALQSLLILEQFLKVQQTSGIAEEQDNFKKLKDSKTFIKDIENCENIAEAIYRESQKIKTSSDLDQAAKKIFDDNIKVSLSQMVSNDRMFIPGGFPGHAMMYEVLKESTDKYTLKIYNTGEGLQYHPYIVDGEKMQYQTYVRYEGFTEHEIQDALIKLLILKIANKGLVYPEYSAKDIYGSILIKRPMTIDEDSPADSFMIGQYSGTCSWRVLTALIRYQFDDIKNYKQWEFLFNFRVLVETYTALLKGLYSTNMNTPEVVKFLRKGAEHFARQTEKCSETKIITDDQKLNAYRLINTIRQWVQQQQQNDSVDIDTSKFKSFSTKNDFSGVLKTIKNIPSVKKTSSLKVAVDIDSLCQQYTNSNIKKKLEDAVTYCKEVSEKLGATHEATRFAQQELLSLPVPKYLNDDFWDNVIDKKAVLKLVAELSKYSFSGSAYSHDKMLSSFIAYSIIIKLVESIEKSEKGPKFAEYKLYYKLLKDFAEYPNVACSEQDARELQEMIEYFEQREEALQTEKTMFAPHKEITTDNIYRDVAEFEYLEEKLKADGHNNIDQEEIYKSITLTPGLPLYDPELFQFVKAAAHRSMIASIDPKDGVGSIYTYFQVRHYTYIAIIEDKVRLGNIFSWQIPKEIENIPGETNVIYERSSAENPITINTTDREQKTKLVRLSKKIQTSSLIDDFANDWELIKSPKERLFFMFALFEPNCLKENLRAEKDLSRQLIKFIDEGLGYFSATKDPQEYLFLVHAMQWAFEYIAKNNDINHDNYQGILKKEAKKLQDIIINSKIKIKPEIKSLYYRQLILLYSALEKDGVGIDQESAVDILKGFYHITKYGYPQNVTDLILENELKNSYIRLLPKIAQVSFDSDKLLYTVFESYSDILASNTKFEFRFPCYSATTGGRIYGYNIIDGNIYIDGTVIKKTEDRFVNDPKFTEVFGNEILKNVGITLIKDAIPYGFGSVDALYFNIYDVWKTRIYQPMESYLSTIIERTIGGKKYIYIASENKHKLVLPQLFLSSKYTIWTDGDKKITVFDKEMTPLYTQNKDMEIIRTGIDSLVLINLWSPQSNDPDLANNAIKLNALCGLGEYSDSSDNDTETHWSRYPTYNFEDRRCILAWQSTGQNKELNSIEFPRYKSQEARDEILSLNLKNDKLRASFDESYYLVDTKIDNKAKDLLLANSLVKQKFDRYLFLTNGKDYKLVIPRRKVSDVDIDIDKECLYSVVQLSNDGKINAKNLTTSDNLYLAYLHLYFKDYYSVRTYLEKSIKLTPYTLQELELCGWIMNSLKENADNDPDAASLRIYAGYLFQKNYRDNPEGQDENIIEQYRKLICNNVRIYTKLANEVDVSLDFCKLISKLEIRDFVQQMIFHRNKDGELDNQIDSVSYEYIIKHIMDQSPESLYGSKDPMLNIENTPLGNGNDYSGYKRLTDWHNEPFEDKPTSFWLRPGEDFYKLFYSIYSKIYDYRTSSDPNAGACLKKIEDNLLLMRNEYDSDNENVKAYVINNHYLLQALYFALKSKDFVENHERWKLEKNKDYPFKYGTWDTVREQMISEGIRLPAIKVLPSDLGKKLYNRQVNYNNHVVRMAENQRDDNINYIKGTNINPTTIPKLNELFPENFDRKLLLGRFKQPVEQLSQTSLEEKIKKIEETRFEIKSNNVEPSMDFVNYRKSVLAKDSRTGETKNKKTREQYIISDQDLESLKNSLVELVSYKENTAKLAYERYFINLANKELPVNDSNYLTEKLETAGLKRESLTVQSCIACFLRGKECFKSKNPNLNDEDIDNLNGSIAEYLLIKTAAQQIKRALILCDKISKCKADSAEKNNYINQLHAEIAATRTYDPKKHPEFLIFEYQANLLLRQQQSDTLVKMFNNGNFAPIELQLVMGGGKTKVLSIINSFLKADGKNLSLNIVPKSLFETNSADMLSTSMEAFGQKPNVIRFDRSPKSCELSNLKYIEETIESTIKNQQYIITTRESIQSLELELYSELDEYSGASIERQETLDRTIPVLVSIMKSISERGVPTIDEIHNVLDCRDELRFTVGSNESYLNSEHIDAVGKIYFYLAKDLNNDVGIFSDKQTTLTSVDFDAIKNKIATRFFNDELLLNEQKTQLKEFLETNKEKIIQYLIGQKVLITENKIEQESAKDFKDFMDRLKIAHAILNKILPAVFKEKLNESYGLSETNKFVRYAIPYKNSKPEEGSRIASKEETICKTIQLYIVDGLAVDQIADFIKLLQNRLTKLHNGNASAIKEAADLESNFRKHFGVSLDKISYSSMSQDALLDIEQKIRSTIKSENKDGNEFTLKLTIDYAKNILKAYKYHDKQLRDTEADFRHFFDFGIQGYSGTANVEPENRDQDLGRVSAALLEEGNSIITSCDATTVSEIFAKVFGDTKDIHAFIDIGATFRGQSNRKIAEEMLGFVNAKNKAIKGILYFDDKTNLLSALKYDDKSIVQIEIGASSPEIIYSRTKLTPEELFTYYDQTHITGTDIKQSDFSRAIVSFSDITTSSNLLQGVMRMRKLYDGTQKVEFVISEKTQEKIKLVLGIAKETELTTLDIIMYAEFNDIETRSENAFREKTHEILSTIKTYFFKKLTDDKLSTLEKVSLFEGIKNGIFVLQEPTDIDDFIASVKGTKSVLIKYMDACLELVGQRLEEVDKNLLTKASINQGEVLAKLKKDILNVIDKKLPDDSLPKLVGDLVGFENTHHSVQEQTQIETQVAQQVKQPHTPYEDLGWEYGGKNLLPIKSLLPKEIKQIMGKNVISVTKNFLRTRITDQDDNLSTKKADYHVLVILKDSKWSFTLVSEKETEDLSEILVQEQKNPNAQKHKWLFSSSGLLVKSSSKTYKLNEQDLLNLKQQLAVIAFMMQSQWLNDEQTAIYFLDYLEKNILISASFLGYLKRISLIFTGIKNNDDLFARCRNYYFGGTNQKNIENYLIADSILSGHYTVATFSTETKDKIKTKYEAILKSKLSDLGIENTDVNKDFLGKMNKTIDDLYVEHKNSIDIKLFEEEIKKLVDGYIEIVGNEKKIAEARLPLAKLKAGLNELHNFLLGLNSQKLTFDGNFINQFTQQIDSLYLSRSYKEQQQIKEIVAEFTSKAAQPDPPDDRWYASYCWFNWPCAYDPLKDKKIELLKETVSSLKSQTERAIESSEKELYHLMALLPDRLRPAVF